MIVTDLHTAITAGAIAGVLFGLVLGTFTFFLDRKYRGKGAEITGNPNIMMEGSANHFVGREGVGGWLYLTDKELYFKSHSINVNTHILVVPLEKVAEAKKSRVFGIIPTGLTIQTTEGKMEKFVAHERVKWVRKINEGIMAIEKQKLRALLTLVVE